jgi:DNA (cytosine-5)-methyltransferase 1
MAITYGSVCSGIEAATVAWRHLGWEAAWYSEIESFPSAVLAHHYPETPNLGDMTLLPEMILSGTIPAPDILCGGTPCQAFSVAGNRESLTDDRGNLSLVFCRIADAIDTIRFDRGELPGIIFWENVPGVLSTKDNAFGKFITELSGESEELLPTGEKWPNAGIICGPERTVCWRVLDSQYFGLAQRRKRLYVVSSARSDIDIGQVLFELGPVQLSHPESRSEGKNNTSASEKIIIWQQIGFDAMRVQTEDISPALSSHMGTGGGNVPYVNIRRLTPRECERLQGFPDDYTQIPYRGKPAADCPDGVRYKALGNSWPVNVIVWIGERMHALIS